MKSKKPGHLEGRLSSLLSRPWAYNLFRTIVSKNNNLIKLVQKYVRPFPGCRILDIGCGTASILSCLPETIGEYTGFDMNPLYIDFARKRWEDRTNCRFFCQKVEDTAIVQGHYDIILAIGILHHLDDNEAARLFDIAHRALRLNGTVITYDNVYVEKQHWFARWFISRDRGKAVRTVEGYKRLAAPYFPDVEGAVLHDTLRIPYTIFLMMCTKKSLSD